MTRLHSVARPETTRWRRRAHSVGIAVTAAALAVLLGFHFTMTTLHAGPTSVLSLQVAPLTSRYMLPFFVQNWHLFAPNPINVDRGLLVRARLRDGAGNTVVTPYYDLTTPAMHHVQTSRLLHSKGPHMISSAISSLKHVDPAAAALRQRLAQRRAAQCPPPGCRSPRLTPHERAKRQEGLTLVRGLASAAALQRWGRGVERIQVRVVTHEFPPYSQRSSSELGEVHHRDLAWMPVREVTR